MKRIVISLEDKNSILFDMDGIIVDSMPFHAEAWQTVLNDCGLSVSREEIYRREGMTGLDSIKDIFKEHNAPIPDNRLLEEMQKKKHRLFENNKIEVFSEVPEILMFLKEKKFKLALVTGSILRSIDYVLPSGLRSFFDVIISADVVDNGKPHPEPYLKAVDQLNTSISSSIVVENAPMGIESAKNAGIYCCAIETTLGKDHLGCADYIFQTHEEFKKYLKKHI